MSTIIYTFPQYQQQAQALAEACDVDFGIIDLHQFPDGESKVTLPPSKCKHAIFYCSLDHPNDKLIELFFAVQTARKLGAKQLTLVAPYLCYMRQDKAFHKGEAVSQLIIGEWFANLFDNLITIDPHLHRVSSMDEVIKNTNNIVLSATPLYAEHIRALPEDYLLIGPDEESEQWVKEVAENSGSNYLVASKVRHSEFAVNISLPEYDYTNAHVILIDDMISTGHTLAETAELLTAKNVTTIDVVTTHVLFDENSAKMLLSAGINNIWSSDSIIHYTNTFKTTALIKDALLKIIR